MDDGDSFVSMFFMRNQGRLTKSGMCTKSVMQQLRRTCHPLSESQEASSWRSVLLLQYDYLDAIVIKVVIII